MSTLNLQDREVAVKIVYYGPGLGGKTSSLQYIHRALKPESRGQLLSLATGADRTLYFDFLPIRLTGSRGFNVRVHLYTVPGQVHYNATRKLVLNGCDGVVFVADSQAGRKAATLESMENLRDNLQELGLQIEEVPLVLQYNKRDCANLVAVDELERLLNPRGLPSYETVATNGRGVIESLKSITAEVLRDLKRKGVWAPESTPATPERDYSVPARGGSVAAPAPTPPPAPGDSGGFPARSTTPVSRSFPQAQRVQEHPSLFAELFEPGGTHDQVAEVEEAVACGDYARAIRRVGEILRGIRVDSTDKDAPPDPVMVAFLCRLAPERFLRVRELLGRVDSGAVSSQDAAFALFFLVDLFLSRQASATRTG